MLRLNRKIVTIVPLMIVGVLVFAALGTAVWFFRPGANVEDSQTVSGIGLEGSDINNSSSVAKATFPSDRLTTSKKPLQKTSLPTPIFIMVEG